MADRTIRAVYEVTVDRAVNNMKKAASEMERLDAQSALLERNLKQLSGTTVKPEINIEIGKAEQAIKTFRSRLDDMKGYKATPKIDAEIGETVKKLEDVGQKLRRLEQQKPSLQVVLEAGKAQSEIERLKQLMGRLQATRVNMQVSADGQKAAAELANLENKARALKGIKASMDIVADARQAQSTMAQTKSEAKSLDGLKARIGITAGKPDFSGVVSQAAQSGKQAGATAGQALMDGLKSQPVVGAVAGILGAAGIAGAAALNAGMNRIRINDTVAAQLNLSSKEASRFGMIAGQTYGRGFGDSYEAAMGGLKAIKINELLGTNATNADMQKLNNMLVNTSTLLGEEVGPTAEAAGALMKNGLAKNATEAMDIIQRGLETGANRSEDWIDTLREYPSMFGSMGISGAEAGKLMSQAMEAGARNTDYAADALKEFSIRAQDESESSAQGFEMIGLSAEDMTSAMAKGGSTARDALQLVLDGLRNTDSAVTRNAAGVALFGTKWEDLGNGSQILAMDLNKASKAFDDVGGAAENAMNRMENSLANKGTQAARTLENTLATASQTILAGFAPALDKLSSYVQQNQAEILGFVQKTVDGVLTAAIGFIEFAATGVEAFGKLSVGISGVLDWVGKLVTGMGYIQNNPALVQLGNDIQSAGEKASQFGAESTKMANGMRDELVPALENVRSKFNESIQPEIVAAKARDAVAQINANMDTLVTDLEAKKFDIKINGDPMPAKEALGLLMEEIQNSPDGYVTIDGNKVPAEEALSVFMTNVQTQKGDVRIGGDATEGKTELENYKYTIQSTKADAHIGANTSAVGSALDGVRVQANNTKGDVKIGGDSAQGRSALDQFRVGINNTKGSAVIDGNAQQGQNQLNNFKNNINTTKGTATIDGNASQGKSALSQFQVGINNTKGTATIAGNAQSGQNTLSNFKGNVDSTTGRVNVDANTQNARDKVNGLIHAIVTASPVMTIWQKVVKGKANGGWIDGKANGGFINTPSLPGRAAGGFVNAPRTLPGVDNVLWPLAYGGQVLNQPLAGGEFVVRAKYAQRNKDLLEYMNNGGTFSVPASGGGVDTAAIANAVASAISAAPIVAEVKDSRTAAAIITMGQRHIR